MFRKQRFTDKETIIKTTGQTSGQTQKFLSTFRTSKNQSTCSTNLHRKTSLFLSSHEVFRTTGETSTVSFKLIRHLVDLSLQPGISGEFIHHVYGGELLLHVLDLCSHLGLLLRILLQQPGHLAEWTAEVSAFPQGDTSPPILVLLLPDGQAALDLHSQPLWPSSAAALWDHHRQKRPPM